jgi:3-oxoacyl-[acyl-carrier-protein] synthase-1
MSVARVPCVAIVSTGLVTSVGLSAPAACAAIRAGLTNATETDFVDSDGEPIMGHQVGLDEPWRGRTKLVKMLGMAIEECLEQVPRDRWPQLPLLLCVAEADRPGRIDDLEGGLVRDLSDDLGVEFDAGSGAIAHGRVGLAVALLNARGLLEKGAPAVVVAAADTLLHWPSLAAYEEEARLLTSTVSNGFIPGEGAGALLVGPSNGRRQLVCSGLGFAAEAAHIREDLPLRAAGLTAAISGALAEAGRDAHELDFRISDASGEQYYFKEAALAVARVLRQAKEEFDIWHPADCVGEVGSVSGLAGVAVANAACRGGYAPGRRILLHLANDAGQRAAVLLEYQES